MQKSLIFCRFYELAALVSSFTILHLVSIGSATPFVLFELSTMKSRL